MEDLYAEIALRGPDDERIAENLQAIWDRGIKRSNYSLEVINILPVPDKCGVEYALEEIRGPYSAVANRRYKRRYVLGHLFVGSLLLEYMSSKHIEIRSWSLRTAHI